MPLYSPRYIIIELTMRHIIDLDIDIGLIVIIYIRYFNLDLYKHVLYLNINSFMLCVKCTKMFTLCLYSTSMIHKYFSGHSNC